MIVYFDCTLELNTRFLLVDAVKDHPHLLVKSPYIVLWGYDISCQTNKFSRPRHEAILLKHSFEHRRISTFDLVRFHLVQQSPSVRVACAKHPPVKMTSEITIFICSHLASSGFWALAILLKKTSCKAIRDRRGRTCLQYWSGWSKPQYTSWSSCRP